MERTQSFPIQGCRYGDFHCIDLWAWLPAREDRSPYQTIPYMTAICLFQVALRSSRNGENKEAVCQPHPYGAITRL